MFDRIENDDRGVHSGDARRDLYCRFNHAAFARAATSSAPFVSSFKLPS